MSTWQEMFVNDLAHQQNAATEPKPIGLAENIQKGGWSGFFDRATLGAKPMIEAGLLYNSTKRFQFDDYPRTEDGWNQRLEDKQRIVDYLDEQSELAQRGLTVPAKVGTVVFDMLPFMVEFVTTGGLASLGKAGAKKTILNLARKYTTNQTARTLANVGSTAVSAGIRASLTPQHIAENYFENRLPQFGLDEQNRVVLGEAQNSPATAIYKAIGDHFIELLSEESGAGIAAMAKGLIPKGVHSSASKLMNSLRKSWIKSVPGRDSLAFARRIAEKGGFHGILEEMGEERLGDVLRATFGVDDFGKKDGNVFDRLIAAIPDGQQLLVEALAFSVPGAAKAAVAAGHEFIAPPQNSVMADTPQTVADQPMEETAPLPQTQPQLTETPQETEQAPQSPDEPTTDEEPAQPQAAESPAAGDRYYSYDGDSGKFTEVPEAEKIEFPHLEGLDFFVAQKNGIWNVYEAVSGLQVGANHKSKKRAIGEAQRKLANYSVDGVQKYIDTGVEKHGSSPRYPDYKPSQTISPKTKPTQPEPVQTTYSDEALMEQVIGSAGIDSMVEKGIDSQEILARLKQGQPGVGSGGFRASVGGYVGNRKVSTDYIVVETPHGVRKYKLAEVLEKYLAKHKPAEPPKTAEPKPSEPSAPSQFKEGQAVKYPDKTGKMITGTVSHTGTIGSKEYVSIKADPEHEAVVGGGIPIGRKETVPAHKVQAMEEDVPKPKSEEPKKSITEHLSAQKQERLAELKKRFHDKLNSQVNMGFDPEMLTITAEMAALYI